MDPTKREPEAGFSVNETDTGEGIVFSVTGCTQDKASRLHPQGAGQDTALTWGIATSCLIPAAWGQGAGRERSEPWDSGFQALSPGWDRKTGERPLSAAQRPSALQSYFKISSKWQKQCASQEV